MGKVEKFLDKIRGGFREVESPYGFRVRVATPVSEKYVENIRELVNELEKIFRSRHIMGGGYRVTKFADEIRAISPDLEIIVGPQVVILESKRARIEFRRMIEDLTEVIAGEEIVRFAFKNPRQEFIIYPVTGHISVSWY